MDNVCFRVFSSKPLARSYYQVRFLSSCPASFAPGVVHATQKRPVLSTSLDQPAVGAFRAGRKEGSAFASTGFRLSLVPDRQTNTTLLTDRQTCTTVSSMFAGIPEVTVRDYMTPASWTMIPVAFSLLHFRHAILLIFQQFVHKV